MLLSRNLILYFVDFSKAFENCSVLFYKIMKCGWYGKVIVTLRSLYTKAKFRVKHQGWLSHLMGNVMGVNQGGIASGFFFRKYMSDLGTFLDSEYGICVEEKIIAHILWPYSEVTSCAGLLIRILLRSAFLSLSHALSLLWNINRDDVTTWNTFCITGPSNDKSTSDPRKWRVGDVLSHCDPVTIYGDISMGQHWRIVWWDQTITWIT